MLLGVRVSCAVFIAAFTVLIPKMSSSAVVIAFVLVSIGLSASAQATKLVLNTRSNASPLTATIIDISSSSDVYANAAILRRSSFSAVKKTKILIHGYLDKYDAPYWQNMMTRFLEGEDLNVFRLDWDASSQPPITQASANTATVAASAGRTIRFLISAHGVKPSDVHIIGHSLGGMVAAAIAQDLRTTGIKVGRITGLDPAGVLTKNDATVVDTIITTGATPGSARESIGHINFMPNGGQTQVGCSTTLCSHIKAMSLFTESISNRDIMSTQCSSYALFLQGACNGQPKAVFGYNVDLSLATRTPGVKLYSSGLNAQDLCAIANAGRFPPVPC